MNDMLKLFSCCLSFIPEPTASRGESHRETTTSSCLFAHFFSLLRICPWAKQHEINPCIIVSTITNLQGKHGA